MSSLPTHAPIHRLSLPGARELRITRSRSGIVLAVHTLGLGVESGPLVVRDADLDAVLRALALVASETKGASR